MILLDREKYDKVIEPLSRVQINKLFARSVVEKHVTGSIYVDDPDRLETFYVIHPYGMTLLFGKTNNEAFNELFLEYSLNEKRARTKYDWMQAYPDSWNDTLAVLFNGRMVRSNGKIADETTGHIIVNTRVNFAFSPALFERNRSAEPSKDCKIVPTDKRICSEMAGSVVPMKFWDNADQFYGCGIGFTLYYRGRLASTAFSSYIHENQLELGIETLEEYRGHGLAQYVCTRLIDYCIEKNYEPVWSCRLENTASFKLARRLGFVPTIMIPYYRLPK